MSVRTAEQVRLMVEWQSMRQEWYTKVALGILFELGTRFLLEARACFRASEPHRVTPSLNPRAVYKHCE